MNKFEMLAWFIFVIVLPCCVGTWISISGARDRERINRRMDDIARRHAAERRALRDLEG